MHFLPWSAFADAAIKAGYSADLMVECGLIRKRKEGDGYYDFYRDRIMIPIRDRFRNIIGWTARDMSEVDGTPKYLNSCQSDIYDKSDSIFGIDNAIRQAAKEEKVLLCGRCPRCNAPAIHRNKQHHCLTGCCLDKETVLPD